MEITVAYAAGMPPPLRATVIAVHVQLAPVCNSVLLGAKFLNPMAGHPPPVIYVVKA